MAEQKTLTQLLFSDAGSAIQEAMESVTLEDGEVLFRQGDPGDAFYVVDSGQVRVFILDEDGKDLTLNTLGPGEGLGELSLVDDQPRSAGVDAVGPATLRRLRREDFLARVHASPELTDTVVRLLSTRTRHMTGYIQRLGQWARMVAEGKYKQAMKDIRAEDSSGDRALAAVAAAVETMVEAVREREEKLKQEVQQLRIQIDEDKRQRQVDEITETDYFQQLTQQARDLRQRSDSE